uniref:CLIP domain-containing serine protease n=1 Tax=Glossina brevipalpis TaxID=37001 RepID=A0A1A9WB40_9MUSC
MFYKSAFLIVKLIILLNAVRHSETYGGASHHCYNPNGRLGRCISVYECETILKIFVYHQTGNFEFASKSECTNGEGNNKPYVCCTADTGFTDRTEYRGHRIIFPNSEEEDDDRNDHIKLVDGNGQQLKQNNLFPKQPNCGHVAVSTKIYGGDEAELTEFAWMANLEYKTLCAGNIINKRYILTAAHCIVGAIEQEVGRLVSLRIGDHYTQSFLDCDASRCIDPFQRLEIESYHVHENFQNITSDGIRNLNDIALIRTTRDIRFKDSVQPVCLPDAELLSPLKAGMLLTVAGWGHNGTVKYTNEKRKVDVPYVENRNCRFKVTDSQLCAGGVFLKDSCTGDSGGPLMRISSSRWVIEGIVSYGRGCALEQPAVYTRVRNYIQWIHDHVAP